MSCTVYPDKTYHVVSGTVFVAMLAGSWYFTWTYLHRDVVFLAGIGGIGLIAAGSFVASLRLGGGPHYRADDAGVYDRRQFKTTVPWSDVLGVERLPRREQSGGETTFHLKEGWRPVVLTLREPEKHLRGIRRWAQTMVPGDAGADLARVRMEFTGLQPLSEEFYRTIQHHLAKRE